MYAVMRFTKLKTMGDVAAVGKHNDRTRSTPNADPALRGENVRLAGTGDWCADVQARLSTVPVIRRDQVLALEYVMTASPAFFKDASPDRLATWTKKSMEWLQQTYGPQNVVAAVLHRDEITPHIQAVVVPIDERGRLNAHAFTGGRALVSAQQTGYARAMEGLGLQRGVEGSVASHQTVKEFYTKIQEPTPAPEIVTRAVAIDPPGHLVRDPDGWASAQQEKIAREITPALDAALTKARHYEEQAARAVANMDVLQMRVRILERSLGELASQVRDVDLVAVMGQLGGERDRHDTHKWHVGGEHISITGAKFYNHDRHEGGGGAIDLVKHLTGYDFKGAVGYLAHTLGTEVGAAAAVQHVAPRMCALAERAERPPFKAPVPDPARWPAVRTYLTAERGVPSALVEALHRQGLVYADARANAVFLRRDPEGTVTGASLRGTAAGSTFKGLAAGSGREEGHFWYTWGERQPFVAPQFLLAEAPIDAMSLHVLRYQGPGQVTVVSTDGAGALPVALIDRTRTAHGLVHAAFDNDRAGEKMWARLQEHYPDAGDIVRERPPEGHKDWNAVLLHERGALREERVYGDGRERERRR